MKTDVRIAGVPGVDRSEVIERHHRVVKYGLLISVIIQCLVFA